MLKMTKNNILVLGKDLIQGINGTTIYAEKLSSVNFTEHNKKLCLSMHCNGANSYLFVNGTEIHKFKARHSQIFNGKEWHSTKCLDFLKECFLQQIHFLVLMF